MFYFVYKTTLKNSDKFYIGRHSTNNLNDGYFGSGKWVQSIKDKSLLDREILYFADSLNELIQKEEEIIQEYFLLDSCMNFSPSSTGFKSGKDHPFYGKPRSDETKEKLKKKKNVSAENREKLSSLMKERRKNAKETTEQKEKRSNRQKYLYHNSAHGLKEYNNSDKNVWIGKNHSEKSIEKMKSITKGQWFNNGIEEKRFPKESRPENWEKGRLKKEKWLSPAHEEAIKISNSQSFPCQHCQKMIKGRINFNRWHNDNCKFK